MIFLQYTVDLITANTTVFKPPTIYWIKQIQCHSKNVNS